MASNELIVDDDYCKAMGKYFEEQGTRMDNMTAEYISILREVRNSAIISGDVADTLSVYISYVEKLNKKIGVISVETKSQVNQFLSKVDAEDKYLF